MKNEFDSWRLSRFWRGALKDAHAYGGLISAASGAGWWVHPGAGLIVLGLGLLGLFAFGIKGKFL